MYLLDLKMLHAAIIDQLCWDPFLRWEIKIDIGQKCDCHWRIKGSQSIPSEQKISFFALNPWIFNKKVDTECCCYNQSSTKYDVKRIISKSLSISDSCENRLEKDQSNLLRGIDNCLGAARYVLQGTYRIQIVYIRFWSIENFQKLKYKNLVQL